MSYGIEIDSDGTVHVDDYLDVNSDALHAILAGPAAAAAFNNANLYAETTEEFVRGILAAVEQHSSPDLIWSMQDVFDRIIPICHATSGDTR